jgi:hypothetical protein
VTESQAPLLAACEGFDVHTSSLRVGTVEEVCIPEGRTAQPHLAVRAGLLGSWRVLVPANEVEAVDRHARRVVLRSGALLAGPRRARPTG